MKTILARKTILRITTAVALFGMLACVCDNTWAQQGKRRGIISGNNKAGIQLRHHSVAPKGNGKNAAPRMGNMMKSGSAAHANSNDQRRGIVTWQMDNGSGKSNLTGNQPSGFMLNNKYPESNRRLGQGGMSITSGSSGSGNGTVNYQKNPQSRFQDRSESDDHSAATKPFGGGPANFTWGLSNPAPFLKNSNSFYGTGIYQRGISLGDFNSDVSGSEVNANGKIRIEPNGNPNRNSSGSVPKMEPGIRSNGKRNRSDK